MSKQLLFCVEADKRSKTDWVYIKSVIDKYYVLDNSISVKPVYMGGKTNYRRSKVISEIRSAIKQFSKTGDTIVIFCVDTDDLDKNHDRLKEFKDVESYCKDKSYEFVWFCRDVEEVFWGSRIHDSDKVDMAKRFRSQNKIEQLITDNILKDSPSIGCSNIKTVLDGYLKRKDEL